MHAMELSLLSVRQEFLPLLATQACKHGIEFLVSIYTNFLQEKPHTTIYCVTRKQGTIRRKGHQAFWATLATLSPDSYFNLLIL